MKTKIDLTARILMGLIFTVFGANGLLMVLTGSGFIPMPPPPPEVATIMGGFMGTIYLMPLVKILEISGGLMLLSGNYVNLAIVLLTPIIVNILGVHLFVDLSGLPMAIALVIMMSILIKNRWSSFSQLLNRK